MADRQLEASFCNRKGWAREWYTGSLWQPEDALHQVVVFKLTLLVFVLGGLVVADATLTASLSKMFSSLTRHWAELCTLLKFKITESVEHCLWVGDTHTHTHTQVPVGSQLLPKYVWLPGNHGRFEGHSECLWRPRTSADELAHECIAQISLSLTTKAPTSHSW